MGSINETGELTKKFLNVICYSPHPRSPLPYPPLSYSIYFLCPCQRLEALPGSQANASPASTLPLIYKVTSERLPLSHRVLVYRPAVIIVTAAVTIQNDYGLTKMFSPHNNVYNMLLRCWVNTGRLWCVFWYKSHKLLQWDVLELSEWSHTELAVGTAAHIYFLIYTNGVYFCA